YFSVCCIFSILIKFIAEKMFRERVMWALEGKKRYINKHLKKSQGKFTKSSLK
ncbi:hypothetical protein L9F63_028272, partial [Diploptera punctata]